MSQSTNQRRFLVILGCFLVVGLFASTCWFVAREMKSDGTELVNPALRHVENNSLSLGERLTLQKSIEAYTEAAVKEGKLVNYGLYYRELISGPVIALREEQDFSPASLLKLPVAMWYYKQSEKRPGLLDEKIEFTGPKNVTILHFLPTYTIKEGTIYSVRELIELMITQSDNDATQVLVEYAGGRDRINEVYQELGIRDVENYDTYVIDVHTYAAFFRVLYNAEYLGEKGSGELLEMLTRSAMTRGIAAGVLSDAKIAHKFGERSLAQGVEQFHDCGIVYATMNPYLLCIMSQGDDYEEMANFVAEVSRMVYESAGRL